MQMTRQHKKILSIYITQYEGVYLKLLSKYLICGIIAYIDFCFAKRLRARDVFAL